MKPATIGDALLPGAGLVLDGRPAWGLPLLVPAILIQQPATRSLTFLTVGAFIRFIYFLRHCIVDYKRLWDVVIFHRVRLRTDSIAE